MSETRITKTWDRTVDLLVVGSGAGAMTTALCAEDLGAKTLVIEKSSQYGGSTAMSGGGLWIPTNHLMEGLGVDDTPDEAMDYLKGVTNGVVREDRLEAYVKHAPQMLKYLCDNSRLDVIAVPGYSDYFPQVPGAKAGARTCEPKHFDAKALGKEFYNMRPPAPQTLIMKRIAFTIMESYTLGPKGPGWQKLLARLAIKYLLDIGGRVRSQRDRNLAFGNALIAMLRLSLMDRDIPLWLSAPAVELIMEGDRVIGVVAVKDGQQVRIHARKGVVLAAGGFEANDEMRKKYLPHPTSAAWSCGNPYNTGDAIRMGLEVGAALDLMDHAWWGPTTLVPGEAQARMLVVEKSKPGCVFVNEHGQRHINEATPYNELVHQMYQNNKPDMPTIPTYLIFDKTFRNKYQVGPMLPGAQVPDFLLTPKIKRDYVKKDMTLSGLAAQMNINAEGLQETVNKIAEYSRTGKDLDFQKGDNSYDKVYGDPAVGPNPCLGPIETPPFYGVRVYTGDIGTKGGLVTDTKARVLTEAGDPIPGLYAIGNCSSAVMGHTYAGGGATIGPAMTFGYIAALDAIPAED